MNIPLISVIVPCYNQAQYLPEALDSVLAQTYTNWECIIVNDGSPDNTEEIAKTYCNKDSRFKYILKENGGLSSARNAGMANAKGQYIQFLDADDFLVSTKFEKQLKVFNQNDKTSICISNYSIYSKGKITPSKYCHNFTTNNTFRHDILFEWDKSFSIPIHSALFRNGIVNDIKFDTLLFAKEDWLFWVEISTKKPLIKYVDESLVIYRIHSQSMIHQRWLMQKNTITALFAISKLLHDEELKLFLSRIENYTFAIIAENHQVEDEIIMNQNKLQSSYAYRLGKIIIKPLSLLRRILKK
ncbi:MAG: glycosyltransferase family 2 protein [Bacteroidota bacterium]|nr:glycosyltransferase family 2 protein [Bacteroidota bacterium]